MKLKKILFVSCLVILGLGIFSAAKAHNPRLVDKQDALIESPIQISSPEISQAFYGRLKGWEEYYQFTLATPAEFYFQMLVPDVKDIQKNISAELILADSQKVVARLRADKAEWTPFFEPFAGDNYFEGPEQKIDLEAGTYLVKVFNPENNGKYVLVVGQKELFTAAEVLNTVVNLPALKVYFNQSPLSAYFNRVGLFLGGGLLGLLILIALIRFIKKRFRSDISTN